MKLIGSKVHDYYDIVRKQGHDESGNIFLREPQELNINIKERWSSVPDINAHLGFLINDFKLNNFEKNIKGRKFKFYPFKILVAGKIYGGFKVKYERENSLSLIEDFFYSYNSFYNFLTKFEIILSNEKSYLRQDKTLMSELVKVHFNIITKYTNVCIENKLVIAIIQDKNMNCFSNSFFIKLNCELKQYEFFKVMDAFTIYQELAMYVDGQLAFPGNQLIEIEDKYKITGHGFDIKKSFRKDPTKKRK